MSACGDDGESDAEVAGRVSVFNSDKEEGPPKSGGAWQTAVVGDPPSLDPYRAQSIVTQASVGAFVYSRLMKHETGPGSSPSLPKYKGDLAESYEISPDGANYTFKLRQGVKFHNVPPVSGRTLEAQDVITSHNRFVSIAPQAGAVKNLVENVSAPDSRTVVYKLVSPNANFINTVTQPLLFWVMPKEQGAGWDPQEKTIGTGPWLLTDFVPSSRMEYKRNPEYCERDVPYMDGVDAFVILETVARLAQFRAGSIYSFTPSQLGDFTSLYEANSKLRVLKDDIGTGAGGVAFGRGDPNSPFLKDARIRRAVSLAIDRDTLIEAINDYDNWRRLGLEREYRLINFVPANDLRWWTDPRGKEMGDQAKWFQYDVAEAKKLMAAAGYANGFETEMRFASGVVPPPYQDQVTFIADQLNSIGIKVRLVPEDYATGWNPRSWAGESPGITYGNWQAFGDPDLSLDYLFGKGSRNQMRIDDPVFNQMYAHQSVERDEKRRRMLLIDMYKHLAEDMRHVPVSALSIAGHTMSQPFVRNDWVYRTTGSGAATETLTRVWLDL
jgi:peptide/nickel transport system substrate-binding protein